MSYQYLIKKLLDLTKNELNKLEIEIYFINNIDYNLWLKILSHASSVKTIRTPGKIFHILLKTVILILKLASPT